MIPEYIAAYAAGIYDAGTAGEKRLGLTWTQVSAVVAAAGMGSYGDDELADAAAAYRRAHVSPEAIAFLNSLRRRAVR